MDEEGKVYTFTLRDGVTFHNGEAVTVEDVKASIERNAGIGDGEALVAAFSNIESVDTPDDRTVVITLATPDTDFISNMTVAILPANHLDETATDPIGTGPSK